MQEIDVNVQQKMQEELDRYLAHKNEPKDYFTSMKEITSWLQEKSNS